ncbi:MAG: multi-sensor signal transduction histidine kinase [Chthoniobacteraceae bacterium]|nr:multi-sensor signal transduction histidine kinase [Chthoniobacteraceae bacterium]
MDLVKQTRMRILVVDDDPVALAAMRRLLSEAGHEVMITNTGEEGLRLVRELLPDLVLMDVNLPGISGMEAVKRLKADPALSSIFAVNVSSSLTTSENQASGLNAGADGYIVRPIPNRELLARVNAFLRQKKMADALRASEERFSNSFEFAPIGIALVAMDGKCLKANRALCEALGYSEAELLTRSFQEITDPDDLEIDRENRQKLVSGEIRSYQIEKRYLHISGHSLVVLLNISIVRDIHREPLYFILHIQDITERKRTEKKLQEALKKEALLRKETHHRIKNNLQVIASLLYLQSQHATDLATMEVLRESQHRTRSIALIHEKLYQSSDLSKIELSGYLQELAASLFESYRTPSGSVGFKISAEGIFLELNAAIPCGLILNELISNALKHAFPEERRGEIVINFKEITNNTLKLSVCDNGVGLPEGFDPAKVTTLGIKLVCDLTKQLDGTVEFRNARGTTVEITFPKPQPDAS